MRNAYKPDFMLIKLNKDFTNFHTEGLNRALFCVLIHEWLHYFHNVSTNFGMTTFLSTASLWTYFHNSNINGKTIDHTEYNQDIDIHKSILAHSRTNMNNGCDLRNINKRDFNTLEIFNAKLKSTQYANVTLHTYICQIRIKDQPEYTQTIEIGALEIFENLAYLLEKKLFEDLQPLDTSDSKFDSFSEPPIVPYRMIELLLKYFELNLSNDDCIRMMITLLIAVDSFTHLEILIHQIKTYQSKGKSAETCLIEFTENNLKQSNLIETLNLSEKWIEQYFPVDDTIGLSVKSVFNIIKTNLEIRYSNPFVEFEILNQLKENPNNYLDVLNKYSSCAMMVPLATNEIIDQSVNRELIILGEAVHLENWQQFHAALHFLLLHIKKDGGLMDTSEISNICCPFYEICPVKPKVDNNDICRNRPWENYDTNNPTSDTCWYGAGVRQTIYSPNQ
ncbi:MULTISPECIES: hypothetical protein [Acinetobacter]|uniref:hypothetical protein n=1 Tax=Acinetobacter TaxID=469 RepID=UPI0002AEDB1B|nr:MULTISPECIES: hypothetical protein [Acinetobacter]ELW77049.1 hypothetical protein ACINWC743_A0614 [Acinetobacter sp. WC-743]MBJ8428141.1 hypothetical protein [Acinetobacter bereziniae]